MSANLLAPGVGFLALSLLTTVLAPHDSASRSELFVGWLTTTSFWLGIVFVAAHLLQEILRERR